MRTIRIPAGLPSSGGPAAATGWWPALGLALLLGMLLAAPVGARTLESVGAVGVKVHVVAAEELRVETEAFKANVQRRQI